MQWPIMEKCREFMRNYAILKKFEYKQKKNDNLKIILVCKDPLCLWRVYVRKFPKEHIAMLRSFQGHHTCKCNDKEMNSVGVKI